MSLEKIHEEMWCYHCQHYWETDDYYNENKCPNCDTTPIHIMRTSSFSFFYAYLERNPEEKKKMDDSIADVQAKFNSNKEKK